MELRLTRNENPKLTIDFDGMVAESYTLHCPACEKDGHGIRGTDQQGMPHGFCGHCGHKLELSDFTFA